MADPDIVLRETDARFWAQTNFKPGQKLDPANTTDRAMIPVWRSVRDKVRSEYAAGTLRTTYDHPEVNQGISDAAVAAKAAAAHLDSAVTTPDFPTAQEHIAAATTAAQISAQKAQEAAAKQPPSVPAKVAKAAAAQALRSPPSASASSEDHLAHEEASAAGHKRPSRETLFKETNARFWAQTGYKPGQSLDMAVAQDRKMAKVWLEIFHQLERKGTSTTFQPPPPMEQPYVFPSVPPLFQTPPPMEALPYASPPFQAPVLRPPPMPPPMSSPMPPPMSSPMPPPMPPFFQTPIQQRPLIPSTVPMNPPYAFPPMPALFQTRPSTAPAAPPPFEPSLPSSVVPSPDSFSSSAPETPVKQGSSFRMYLTIGAALLAGSGLIYYATRTPSRNRATMRVRLPKRSSSEDNYLSEEGFSGRSSRQLPKD